MNTAWGWVPLSCLICLSPPAARAGELVTVDLRSGRSTTAEIDARTDDRLLWLRTSAESMIFRRSVPWSEVLGATHGEQQLTPAELRQAAEAWKTDLTPADVERAPQAVETRPSQPAIPHHPPALPLQALAIDARLANFNATVEADGVWVEICPLDSHGHLAAVWGTLEINVIAHRRGPSDYPAAFPKVASAVFNVQPAQFGPSGAAFLVPYHRPHPEFDTNLAPRGLVHARLNVPGEGRFEATTEVRLRPYSVVRDQLQLLGYPRFLPIETRGW
jgi:hypothetical protein